MSYIFRDIEPKIYKKTFLKDVHVRLEFDSAITDASRIADFLQNNFNLSINYTEEQKEISINSEDSLISFDFDTNSVEVTLRHPAYKSFAFVMQWLPCIKAYLAALDVVVIKKIYISKYNELAFSLPNNNIGLDIIMSEVFSKDLLEREETKSNQSDFASMARWEMFGSFNGEDNWNSVFSYEYGFCRKATDLTKGSLTLKLIMESVGKDIEVKELSNVLEQFNSIIDKGFHWCVNDKIIAKMDE